MSMSRAAIRFEPLLAVLLSLGAVGAALVSQHHFDMQPCPWCVLQRLVFVVIAEVAILEGLARLTLPGSSGVRIGGPLLRIALALAGVAAAAWQHFVAAAQASCNLTLADRILALTGLDGWLPDVFQPRASCLEAKVALLGVPYEFWSGALFALLAAMAVWNLRTLKATSTAAAPSPGATAADSDAQARA